MFSELVVGYLFLGGVGAGACFFAALLGLLAPKELVTARPESAERLLLAAPREYRRLIAPPLAAGAAAIAVGLLLLLFDLGLPSRAALLLRYPTPTYQTVGAIALVALLAASLLLLAAWGIDGGPRWRFGLVRLLHVATMLVSLVVAVYTGLLLSSMPAVPLWRTAWVPVLFTASALSCGCAVVVASAHLTGSLCTFATVVRRVLATDVALLLVEAAAVVGLAASARTALYGVAGTGMAELLTGSLSALFVGGFVTVGLALPLVLEAGRLALPRKIKPDVAFVAATAVLVGGFVLRYCIVAAGAHPEVWAVVL